MVVSVGKIKICHLGQAYGEVSVSRMPCTTNACVQLIATKQLKLKERKEKLQGVLSLCLATKTLANHASLELSNTGRSRIPITMYTLAFLPFSLEVPA